ncbi:hypothetical protein [Acidovorax sp. 99]|uniref:hypothetical protein n=1 Tax=Acidovorax sp. 99 TaxID=2135634 RepID=UPI000E321496|nr:hypothetical protein [Acidovorax sp. 99]
MDATLWPWLAAAAMGALHGLNPLTGWGLATTWSLCARDHSMPLRALLPMAVGHLAAVALTAARWCGGCRCRHLPCWRWRAAWAGW